MPVTMLDLAVLGIVLLSALLAAVRGFTREVLAIASWAAAAAAAYYFHPMLLPFAKEYISNDKAALAAAIAAIFFGTLIVVSFFTVKISDLILDSRIGAVDRSLGFLFGAARGLLIAVIAFVFYDKLVGDQKNNPEWVRQAKLRPLLKETGDQIIALLPENPDFLGKLKKPELPADEPVEPPTSPSDGPAPAPQKRTDTRDLQRLIEATGSTNPAAPKPSPQGEAPKR